MNELQQFFIELDQFDNILVECLVRTLALRDGETEEHTRSVVATTLNLAQVFNIPDEEIIHIQRGALLHDIGKIGIPDYILHKNGPLSKEEWLIMQKHPQYAFDLLYPIVCLRPALDIPYCHHEKWDGTGYPRGLKGDQIPLSARLFAVVDVWDALLTDRPYRPAWSIEQTIDYIRAQSGYYFDPCIVEKYLSIVFQNFTIQAP